MSCQGRAGQARPSSGPLPPPPLGELTVSLARLAAILTANDLDAPRRAGHGRLRGPGGWRMAKHVPRPG